MGSGPVHPRPTSARRLISRSIYSPQSTMILPGISVPISTFSGAL